MQPKPGKIYVDWWKIKKSTVIGGVAIVLFLASLVFGGWYLVKNDFFLSQTAAGDIPKDAAQLISYEGDVRIVRVATRETILVTRRTYVSAGDTVQTGSDGRAQIQMIDGSTLSVRPNSTIVIRDSTSILGGSDVRVSLDEGGLNVKTEDQAENTKNIVEVQESENRLYGQTDASFRVNENSGGEIRVSRGSVETNVGGGSTVLQGDEYASVKGGKIQTKEKLLSPPNLIEPAASGQIPANARGRADVSMRWQSGDGTTVSKYQLQISTSPFFVSEAVIIARDSITSNGFSSGNFEPGNYYWRVRAVAVSGQISDWSEPQRFAVVKRESSKKITAEEWQVEPLGGSIYVVKGKTNPGARVQSAEREVFASSDGSFSLQISATGGQANIIISDERGNRSGFVLSLSNARVVRKY